MKIEWPRNVLRHSFISYRIATVKSADQVALEAGNSPSIRYIWVVSIDSCLSHSAITEQSTPLSSRCMAVL